MTLDTTIYSGVFVFTYTGQTMAKAKGGKREALARDGALNPHPEAVRDALFADNPFFDPADLVQVRYEMVRRHEADGQAISEVAARFGVSPRMQCSSEIALSDISPTSATPVAIPTRAFNLSFAGRAAIACTSARLA